MVILHYLFGLCVLTTYCIQIVIDSIIQERYMMKVNIVHKRQLLKLNDNDTGMLKFIYICFVGPQLSLF